MSIFSKTQGPIRTSEGANPHPVPRKLGNSICGWKCRRLVHSQEGGPLVELAFVMPIMMALVTGIFTFGVAIYNALVLTQATGAGAQYLQTLRIQSAADPCAATLGAIENAAPTLQPANIGLSISINGGTPYTGTTCPSAASSLAQYEPVTVSTTYPCALAVYGMSVGGCHLAAKVTEYEY